MSSSRISALDRHVRRSASLLAFGVLGLSACATTMPSNAVGTSERDATSSVRADVEMSSQPTESAPPVDDDAAPPTTTGAPASSTSTTIAAAPTSPPEPAEPIAATPVALTYVPPTPVSVPALETPLVAVNTSDGVETARVQERLLELGFWLQRSDGDYGLTTTQAVMAFQKYHGLATSASVDEATAALLSAEGTRATGLADAGTLVEIDKSRQLVFIVQDGLAAWVLNGSTGSEIPYEAVNDKDPTKIERGDAVTPVGLYHTERERPDGWWAGDLGEIYRPKYFVGGIAVHGSNSIPNYPASHGCVRVSVPAMDFIWESDLMPLGINVWVHGEIPSA